MRVGASVGINEGMVVGSCQDQPQTPASSTRRPSLPLLPSAVSRLAADPPVSLVCAKGPRRTCVGMRVGDLEGWSDGVRVGRRVGMVGDRVGNPDGNVDGYSEGVALWHNPTSTAVSRWYAPLSISLRWSHGPRGWDQPSWLAGRASDDEGLTGVGNSRGEARGRGGGHGGEERRGPEG
jgi:hypothetical protein